jgi:beta-phosphoglucomutase family hydrolase
MFHEFGIIFDMDGVLADTGPIHFESWVKMANEIGYEFTKELFEETFGQQSIPITRKLVGDDIDLKLVRKWANLKEKYYREMMKDKIEPLPGVINLLKNLKKNGFKLAVGSSGPPENVKLILNNLKIESFFNVVVTAAQVRHGKPDPEVFLITAKNLRLKPQNCIVIEDAPVGIKAAKKAGMKSIAITTTHNEKELFEADRIVNDLTNININDLLLLFELEIRRT